MYLVTFTLGHLYSVTFFSSSAFFFPEFRFYYICCIFTEGTLLLRDRFFSSFKVEWIFHCSENLNLRPNYSVRNSPRTKVYHGMMLFQFFVGRSKI